MVLNMAPIFFTHWIVDLHYVFWFAESDFLLKLPDATSKVFENITKKWVYSNQIRLASNCSWTTYVLFEELISSIYEEHRTSYNLLVNPVNMETGPNIAW